MSQAWIWFEQATFVLVLFIYQTQIWEGYTYLIGHGLLASPRFVF